MLRLGTVMGVPVKLHWSFALFIPLFLYLIFIRHVEMLQLLVFSSLLLILFASVLIHELGHAFTANVLNVRANDIVLSPIGGLARLESMERFPRKEIKIALAGPLANLIVSVCLFVYLYFIMKPGQDFDPFAAFSFLSLPAVLYFALFINLMLFALNLIPAFPMDGGRILRALLSLKYGPLKATRIASVSGRVFAVVFLVLALFYRNYALIIISLFIYIMATAEFQSLKDRGVE